MAYEVGQQVQYYHKELDRVFDAVVTDVTRNKVTIELTSGVQEGVNATRSLTKTQASKVLRAAGG